MARPPRRETPAAVRATRTTSHQQDRTTLGDVLADLDAQLFVGREEELALFQRWLGAQPAPAGALYLWGPGGSGKSALLRAFARTATKSGRVVVHVDGRDLRAQPDDFARALGGPTLAAAIERLNAQRAVILIDTFELLVDLTRVIQRELLPGLGTDVRLVIAGRQPLGLAWQEWRRVIRDIPLGSLTPAEVRTYLERRDVHDARLVNQVLKTARGLPLAVNLITDLVVRLGPRDLGATTEWHRQVRWLVEQLLSDAQTTVERELLEAGSVVQHFDEALLAAMTEREDVSQPFAALCQLSIVRPGRFGLVLHDDIRHILVQDLRWRQPERYRALRVRALAFYRQRMQHASPAEREWLLGERLSLWENAFIQAMLFTEADAGRVWLDWGRPEDHEDVVRVWSEWTRSWLATQIPVHADLDAEHARMRAILAYSGNRLRVARDGDNRIVGFSTSIALCRESLPIITAHPGLAVQVNAVVRRLGDLQTLPPDAASANTYLFCNLAHTELDPEATQQALIRDVFGLFARGERYLVVTPIPAYKGLFDALGFERIEDSKSSFWSPQEAEEAFFLDLTKIGVETWIEAIVAGQKLPQMLSVAEVAQSLQTEVLPNWRDDARLHESKLAVHLASASQSTKTPAALVREMITHTIESLKQDATEDRLLAVRALEGAYLHKRSSYEQLAERLGVSRSTFYRLLKRGVADLAASLDTRVYERAGL